MGLDPIVPGGAPQPGAPTDARYLLQTADARLANAQALAALGAGLLKTGAGGVVALAEAGTDYALPGGGGAGYPVQPVPRVPGSIWGSAGLLFAGPPGPAHAYPGGYYTQPVPIAAPMHLERIGLFVLTPAPAGATARLGLWADDKPGGGPGTLLHDAGEVAIDAADWQEAFPNLDLAAGLVWATLFPSDGVDVLGLTAIHLPALGIEGFGDHWAAITGFAGGDGTAPADPFPATHPDAGLTRDAFLPLVWLGWQS